MKNIIVADHPNKNEIGGINSTRWEKGDKGIGRELIHGA
jgi:hypothetical protein